MKRLNKCITKYCRGTKGLNGNSICSKCSMRAWRAANPDKARLSILRNRAARKKLNFDLDLDWLINFLRENNYDSTLHHIDRKCVLGGYTKNNLQILPMSDNIAKGNRERHGQAHMF